MTMKEPLVHARVAAATTSRERFLARLVAARVCAQGAQHAVARALFEELEREATARGLDEWEPALAAECLEGLLVSARALAKAGKPLPTEAAAWYNRLCRLDPAIALRLGP
jgi:type VI secretion system protein VasJ